MIGSYPIASAAIASLVAFAGATVPPVIPPEPPGGGGSGGGATIHRPIKLGTFWSKASDMGLEVPGQVEQEPVYVSVPTAIIRSKTYPVVIEITQSPAYKVPVSLKTPTGTLHMRVYAPGYKLRMPKNPTQDEILEAMERLGLVP